MELLASSTEAAAAADGERASAAIELELEGTVEAAPEDAVAPGAEFADEAEAFGFARLSIPTACLSIRDNEDPAAVPGSFVLDAEPTLTVVAAAACAPLPTRGEAVPVEPNVKDAKAALLKLVESSATAVGVSV
ncbi:MAG: hypothetical protein P4L76_11510 [Beijerinckiaceae bacterium]|nr:hypothetical protein [Beijerinckiaceae bacterium]